MPIYNVKIVRIMEWRVEQLEADSKSDAWKAALRESRTYDGATVLSESMKVEEEVK